MLNGGSKKKPKAKSTLGDPRTVRLDKEHERWVDQQPHVDGFSGVVRDAVKFYRASQDQQDQEQRNKLLRAVR